MAMTMRASAALVVLALLCAAPEARAERLFGLYGGAGFWHGSYDGTVRSGADELELGEELDIGSNQHLMVYVGFEHPVGLLPNIRVQYGSLDVGGSSTLARNVTFNQVTFPAGSELQSSLELSQIDGTLYYKLLDRMLSLDLGVTARYFDGAVELATGSERSRVAFEGVVPMGHLATRIELPRTGFWIGGQLEGVGFDGHRLIDASVAGGWLSRAGLGLEAGWRYYELVYDDVDELDAASIDVSGPYGAINLRF